MSEQESSSNESIWKALIDWVHANGGHVHPAVTLQGEGPSRGVFATCNIAKGDLLIRLPPTCVLSGVNLHSTTTASPWLQCLAAYYQAQTDKNFSPYLQSLPAEYETLLQWTDAQIDKYLAGTTLGTMVQLDRKETTLQTRYQNAVKPFLESLGLRMAKSDDDFLLFQHACMCISTRGFHMSPREDDDDDDDYNKATDSSYLGPFLLPVIDLLNHDPRHKCTTLQRTSGVFTMIAERDIGAGEEILHSYGNSLVGAQVLQTFGFVSSSQQRQAADSDCDFMNKTPVVLSKQEHLLPACRKLKSSDYPSQLQASMESNKLDEQEAWEVADLPERPVDYIADDLTISPPTLSEEILTFLCLQFLPEDALEEVAGSMLDTSILEDYYLGHLVCQSLLIAIDAKFTSYRPIRLDTLELQQGAALQGPLERDRATLLLLLTKKHPNLDMVRAMYGLTIRIEEMSGLEALRREVTKVAERLDGQSEKDNAEKPAKRAKLEENSTGD